jgi:hypothetical protein
MTSYTTRAVFTRLPPHEQARIFLLAMKQVPPGARLAEPPKRTKRHPQITRIELEIEKGDGGRPLLGFHCTDCGVALCEATRDSLCYVCGKRHDTNWDAGESIVVPEQL